MLLLPEHQIPAELGERLRNTNAVTADIMSDVIRQTCRRFPSLGQSEKSSRVERLLESGAWTDAALALIELELPLWQLRRIAYDEGEWHCALSSQRELPEWLDSAIETRHADLALAMLSALVEARRIAAPEIQTSVPAVPQNANPMCEPLLCENFG